MKIICLLCCVILLTFPSFSQSRTNLESVLNEKRRIHFINSFEYGQSSFEPGDNKEVPFLFDFDSENLTAESIIHLDSLKEFLQSQPSVKIEIQVHRDSRGSNSYSRSLTSRRAEAIREKLINLGIDSNRLIAKGCGETSLIMTDSEIKRIQNAEGKEKAHQLNRRVEIVILSI